MGDPRPFLADREQLRARYRVRVLDGARPLRAYPSFERGRPYVLYCDFGLMSAHLAELMRREGFDAYHFRGGTRALRRLNPAADAR